MNSSDASLFNRSKKEIKKSSTFKTINYHLNSLEIKKMNLILRLIEHETKVNPNKESNTKINTIYTQKLLKKKTIHNKETLNASKEMEKFFIFICHLSIYQLKILNESQPEPSRKRTDLPIIFNNQFQDCLTNAQRMSLSVFESMNLSRYVILKDPYKDISLENLDFRFMKYRIKDTESESDEEDEGKKLGGFVWDIWNRKYENEKQVMKMEKEQLQLESIIKNIQNEQNKNFLHNHKNSIFKLIEKLNNKEKKYFFDNPQLLKSLINNVIKANSKKKHRNRSCNDNYAFNKKKNKTCF